MRTWTSDGDDGGSIIFPMLEWAWEAQKRHLVERKARYIE